MCILLATQTSSSICKLNHIGKKKDVKKNKKLRAFTWHLNKKPIKTTCSYFFSIPNDLQVKLSGFQEGCTSCKKDAQYAHFCK